MNCGPCGQPADVVQRSKNDLHRYYYCFTCLKKAGMSGSRPYGWDGVKQQPQDEESHSDWRCELLAFTVLSSTPMLERIERQRRNNP